MTLIHPSDDNYNVVLITLYDNIYFSEYLSRCFFLSFLFVVKFFFIERKVKMMFDRDTLKHVSSYI